MRRVTAILSVAMVMGTGSTGSTGSTDSAGSQVSAYAAEGRYGGPRQPASAKATAVRRSLGKGGSSPSIARERRRATGSQVDVQERMRAWSTALGVSCTHCHVSEAWTDSSKPTFEFAQRMMRMVDALNAGPLKDVEPIACWTCHRGQTRPARLPSADWEAIQTRHSAEFATNPSRALAMSVYSASLGVDCMHCHEPETWLVSSKRPFAMVKTMLTIFDEIPKHFDKSRTPVTQCYMCHQGKPKPER